MAAVRCRAALDAGVEAVFEGVSPGYRLEEAAGAETAENTATGAEAALDERRGGWVERLLEEVGREFSGLPVYVGVEDCCMKRTAPTDKRQFRRRLETCRKLGFRFDKGSSRWRSYSHLQRYKPASTLTQPPQAASAQPTRLLLWTGWWRQLPSICVGIWRRLAPPHARRRLGAAEVVRDAAAKRRYTLRERCWLRRGGDRQPSPPS